MSVVFKLKPILPKKFINAAAIQPAIDNVLDELAQEAIEMFEKTTATWQNQPTFVANKRSYGRNIETARNKAGEIFGYVDKGTRPHVIRAKAGGMLVFKGGSKPKTRPRYITSYAGSHSGDTVFVKQVQHPGSEARDFGIIITERIQAKFAKRMNKEIRVMVLVGEGMGL